ncbi:MAG TPA: class I SAM-dependent methyltransferase [Chthoniobacterales bacterium]|nr:class I SAM-dependent methyltransferase [Chthoniobacterales bacterium]
MLQALEDFPDPDAFSIEDEKFDRIYPSEIRKLSSLFWTPVAVAAEAAQLLVTAPGTRVLDVGCGPGKFCLIAASLTEGHFTGVEQRPELITAARAAAAQLHLPEIEFLHANVTDTAFAEHEAFYLFNPFEENMHGHKIDSAIPLSPALYKKYTQHVAAQLGLRPIGTRVVTYAGYAADIPSCYDCELTRFNDDLKLWIKNREYDADVERLGLHISRSYRGTAGWMEPRML